MNDAARAPASARGRAARRVTLAAAGALGLVAVLASREPWAFARGLLAARGTGFVALGLLLLSLCATPAARGLTRLGLARAPSFALGRRALGMAAAWLALGHALIGTLGPLAGNLGGVWSTPHLRAGASALALLLLLLLTSFGAVVARMRLRLWKELHRLAYVAALLALQHLLLSPFAPRTLTLALFAAVALFGLLRLLRPHAAASPPNSS